jgi:hypothetical protein
MDILPSVNDPARADTHCAGKSSSADAQWLDLSGSGPTSYCFCFSQLLIKQAPVLMKNAALILLKRDSVRKLAP